MNFKELLKQKNITQEELGNKLGLSQQTISDWCNGRRTPRMKMLIKLSGLFDMKIDEIVDCLMGINNERR